MIEKKKSPQTTILTEPVTIENAAPANNLHETLRELTTNREILGYILRNTTSASVDLKDSTKISEYALLSSSSIDASKELADAYELGNAKSITVEGKNTKMVSLTIDENKISILLEKNADSEKTLRKLRTP